MTNNLLLFLVSEVIGRNIIRITGGKQVNICLFENNSYTKPAMDNFLDKLNPSQKEAVVQTEGPMLVIAGAGSGKTRVLTSKVRYLLENRQVPFDEIIAVTFTNKAAREMADRIGTKMPWLGTFHSLSAKFLRKHIDKGGIYKNDFVIIDSDDQKKIINNLLKEFNYYTEKKAFHFINFISKHKNKGVTPKLFNAQTNDDFLYADVYQKYSDYLIKNNLLDFDDLLLQCVQVLKNNDQVLKYYQQKIKYVLIDEYQDTNDVQYEFSYLLSGYHKNITAVGDGDQSIYSWRGANFKNISRFEKDFPRTRVVLLEENYRSTERILEAANQVIKNNSLRKEKVLRANKSEGDPISVHIARTSLAEAEYIAKKIKDNDYKYTDVAVVYRTNGQSRQIEETFVKRNIPYTLVGGTRFYERKEIKDIISYLQLIANPSNEHALNRIINTPVRGIGAASLNKYKNYAAEKGLNIWHVLSEKVDGVSSRAANSVNNFVWMIDNLKKHSEQNPVNSLIEKTIQMTRYREYLLGNFENAEDRIDNLNELMAVAQEHPDFRLTDFLTEVSLVSDVDGYDEKKEAVTLMTMHATKGLEFPVVFISGVEEGFLPHARSLTDEEKEEERRLFYVGITRAMHKLYITAAEQRTAIGQTSYRLTSRFIDEIPLELIEEDNDHQGGSTLEPFSIGPERSYREESYTDIQLYPGDLIQHSHFGLCQILKLEPDRTASIKLENGEVKEVFLFAKNVVKKI